MAASTLSQVGFTDFVGQLISEVFDSLISADMTQEQNRAELLATASLDLPEAAAQLVSETEVDAQLALLFPPPQPGETSAVFVGAPYHPAGASGAESPGFAAALGVTLAAGLDYGPNTTGGQALTQAGVQKIRDAARQQLASPRLDALRRMATRGVPRVLVDAGQISATFTFQLESTAPAAAPTAPVTSPITLFAPTAAGRSQLATAGVTSLAATATPTPFRLTLRPASDQAPQATKLQVNVYSSVQISFRTIS